MAQRKTAQQRNAANSKSGKARNKKKTLNQEIKKVLNKDSKYILPRTDTAFFKMLCETAENHGLGIIGQRTDVVILKMISMYWSRLNELDKLLKKDGCVIVEINGNTQKEQKKAHPAMALFDKCYDKIMELMKQVGFTREAFLAFYEKASKIDSKDFQTEKEREDEGSKPKMSEWQKKANPEK